MLLLKFVKSFISIVSIGLLLTACKPSDPDQSNSIQFNANTQLTTFELSTGTLTPEFDPSVTSYSVSVANDVSDISITPRSADSTQSIQVNGIDVVMNSTTSSIALVSGENVITAVVTAEDGVSKRVYVIDVVNLPQSSQELLSNKIYYIEATNLSSDGVVEEITSAEFTGYATDNMSWKDCLWSATYIEGSCESGIESMPDNYIGATIQGLALVDGVLSSITFDREDYIFEWIDQYNLITYSTYYFADQLVGRSASSLYTISFSEIDLAGTSFSKAINTYSDVEISSPKKLLTESFPPGSTAYLFDMKSNYTDFTGVNDINYVPFQTITDLTDGQNSAGVFFCTYYNSSENCNDYKLEFTPTGVINVSVFDLPSGTYIPHGTTKWTQVDSYYGHNGITIADPEIAGYRSIIEMPGGLVGEIGEEYFGNNLSLNAVAEAAFEELLPNLDW